MKYYYANAANDAVGPFELSEIKQLAATGAITEQTNVIPEDSQTWMSYAQLCQSIEPPKSSSSGLPPPAAPPPPNFAPGMPVRSGVLRGASRTPIYVAAAVVVLLAIAGGIVLWLTVFNRPSQAQITAYVTSSMAQQNLHLQSITSHTERSGGQIRVAFTAKLETTIPLYSLVDTKGFLQSQFGLDTAKVENALAQAQSVDPSELASFGPAPAAPASLQIIKVATAAHAPTSYTGTLVATKGSDGWTFTEEPGGQYSPRTPEGRPRAQIQGQNYVADDSTDLAELKAIADRDDAYSNSVANAMPADLPAGVKTVVKLVKAGMSEEAVLNQVHSDGTAYKMTADQVIYLARAGVPQNAIRALIEGNPPPPPPAPPQADAGTQGQPPTADTGAAQPAGPPPAPAPIVSKFGLPANMRWMDTGIDLTPGETVSVVADGTVSVVYRAPISIPIFGSHLPAASNQTPDGTPNNSAFDPIHPFVAQGLPANSLVGRVGDSAPFEIGSHCIFNSPGLGRLYLCVNANSFEQNTGAWNVAVTLPPPSAPQQ